MATSPVRLSADVVPRRLPPSTLLEVWEQGVVQSSTGRALTILAAACPDAPMDTLLRLTVGERDGHLLRSREQTFGRQLAGLVSCPACGERLELALLASDLRVHAERSREGVAPAIHVETAGYVVECRLPTNRDLAALDPRAPLAASCLRLFSGCVTLAEQDRVAVPVSALPAHVVDAVVAGMGDADPQADVHVPIACAACRHEWSAAFDIVSFFWTEIEAWAARLRREVHVLASAYGWSETSILSLSPVRRQGYLELVVG